MDRCISVLVRLFFNWSMSIYLFKTQTFSSSEVFLCQCPFVTIFKCSNLRFHYTFFQAHQIASDIVPILPYKSCICTGDYVFGRDYSNLNNVFQIYIFSNTYTRFIVENRDKIWCNKKGTLLVLHFIKISYLGFF